MRRYAWRGNVRELENLIERAVISLAPARGLMDPLAHLGRRSTPAGIDGPARRSRASSGPTHAYARGDELDAPRPRRGAAARLGMKRKTLQSLMKGLAIARPA